MKNNLILFLSIGIVFVGRNSCEKIDGTGPVISELRNHKGFEGLRVSICGQINFTVALEYKVELKAQENMLDELDIRIDRNALVLKWYRPLRIHDCDAVTVNISGPDLKFINSSGSADIRSSGFVRHNDLDLALSGSGSIELEEAIIRDELSAHISGSGHISIEKGNVEINDLLLSGSGEIDLGNIISESTKAHVSGSGQIMVNVTKRLEAFISGSGDIHYYGNPIIDSKVSGSAKSALYRSLGLRISSGSIQLTRCIEVCSLPII